MDRLAREVFAEQNNVRTNPSSYIPYLKEMISLFKGMVLYKQNEIPLRTNEGPGAVQDCINFLSAQAPLRPLAWDDNMTKAAADHASDIGPKGISGHTGSDGSSMSARLTRYGDWMGKIGENIDFGSKTARDVVISLIVDDGVSNRGHRKNLFSPEFTKTGISSASHSQWDICTVLDYASEYTHKGGNLSGTLITDNTPKFNTYQPYTPPQQFSQTQPTSTTSVNYDSLAREVFQETNKVRQNPSSLIPFLEEHIKLFQGMILKKPGEVPLRTNEGPGAVQECINFLKTQQPIPPLEWDENMTKACRDHANDIGPKSLCSHTGSDGSSMSGRLERYGDWNGKIGENCDFGNFNGRDVVISLIVDDGVSNRGHRNNLFSYDFKKIGVACSAHQEYKVCCVIDYAAQYAPKGQGSSSAPSFLSQQPIYTGASSTIPSSTYQPMTSYPSTSSVSNPYASSLSQPSYTGYTPSQTYGVSSYPATQQPQFQTQSYSSHNPIDNSQTTTTSKTYTSSNLHDPYIQEQLKKFNLDPNLVAKTPSFDPEKPPNTIETLTSKNIQIINGRKTITETKTYKLADGSQRVTERTYQE